MNPKIKVIEDEEILKFTLSGVDVSLANALRRIIINDIPTVVFRTETYQDNQCKIAVNTGRLHNEIIKQRLSCIPIHSTDHAVLPGKYIMELDVTNTEDHIIFVTTEDFRIKNKETGNFLTKEETVKIFPPSKKTGYFIDFLRLRPAIGDIPAEQIKLSCEFSIASAHTNSMFNVVSKCAYAYTPDPAAASKAWEAWCKVCWSARHMALTCPLPSLTSRPATPWAPPDSWKSTCPTGWSRLEPGSV